MRTQNPFLIIEIGVLCSRTQEKQIVEDIEFRRGDRST
jgi:hypothetical protein